MGMYSTPKPDPGIAAAARESTALGKEQFDWYRNMYETQYAPQQERQLALQDQIVKNQIADSEQQRAIANEQLKFYRDNYQPLEKRAIEDATNYDSAENVQRRSGIAAAAVQQQYSQAMEEAYRDLARKGLNPNSSAFARINEKLRRDEALASAGAQTGAAFDTMDRGIALRQGAAGLGRNIANTASQFYGNATQGLAMANQTGLSGLDSMRAGTGIMGAGFAGKMGGLQQGANIYGQDFNARMAGYQANTQLIGSIAGAAGTFAGLSMGAPPRLRADGGHITGPGGPTEDKIPALLSNGEYVIPSDVVKKFGVKYFDQMLEKHHTPAAQQKGGLRRKS